MNNSMESQGTVSQPSKKKQKRSGGVLSKLLILVLFVALLGLFIWAEGERRDAASRLEQTEQKLEEIQQSTQRSGQERADEVLAQARTHIFIAEDPAPTVATIVDVDRLRETSEFYNKAENGDVLIITTDRAILFDPNQNIVIDVVPVRIQQPADGAVNPAGGEQAVGGDVSPSPEASPAESPAL